MAESDNATALILMEQAMLPGKSSQEAARLLSSAVKHLEGAIDLRQRIGNPRGCFQHCRNLGLAHSRLGSLSTEKGDKERYVRLVRKDYENGIFYLNRIRPEPPVGEILECQFRIGELDVQLGDMEDAIKWLEPVESKRRSLGDWHNRARTLDLLRQAYTNAEHKKNCGSEILAVYSDVMRSRHKIKELQDTKVKLTNAKDILERTAKAFGDLGLTELRREALKIRDDLMKCRTH